MLYGNVEMPRTFIRKKSIELKFDVAIYTMPLEKKPKKNFYTETDILNIFYLLKNSKKQRNRIPSNTKIGIPKNLGTLEVNFLQPFINSFISTVLYKLLWRD